MTVSSITSRADYQGNGSTTVFAVPFYFLDQDHLEVTTTNSATSPATVTTLALITDYTVAGVKNEDGGSVILTTPPAATTKVTILRAVPNLQQTHYIENDPFPSASHEEALDLLTMAAQQTGEVLTRALRLPEAGAPITLPPVADRAGKALSFDTDGKPVASIPVDPAALEAAIAPGITATVETALAGTIATSVTTAVDASNAAFAAASGASLVGFKMAGAGASTLTAAQLFNETISIARFGAVGDASTINTAAFNNTISAAISGGYGVIDLPAGVFDIDAPITVTSPLIFRGKGPGKTIIRQRSAGANGIDFAYPSFATGGGVEDLTVEAGLGLSATGFTGAGSSGFGIRVQQANDCFSTNNISIHNFGTAIGVLGCFNSRHTKIEVLFCAGSAIYVDKFAGTIGAGNYFHLCKLSNFGFTGDNASSIGIHLKSSGGEDFGSIDVTMFDRSVVIDPDAGQQVLYSTFESVFADTAVTANWVLDGTNGFVWETRMSNCWGAYCTNGPGLVTKGSHLDGVSWVGGALRENGTQGWHHQGGTNVNVGCNTSIATNGKLAANTYDGVLVDAGVSNWSLTDTRCGNFASTLGTQANGVYVAGGASSNFRIVDNDFTAPGAGKVPVVNGSTVTTFIVQNNLPIQGAGTDNTRGFLTFGNSVGTVAAGTTRYLGPNGQQTLEPDAVMLMPRPGVVSQIIVAVDTVPGAGESFTYTLRGNFADTAMTGTLSGTGSFGVVLSSSPTTFGAGDLLSLKVTTSSGAAPARHRWALAADA